jgi:hypothetical protein
VWLFDPIRPTRQSLDRNFGFAFLFVQSLAPTVPSCQPQGTLATLKDSRPARPYAFRGADLRDTCPPVPRLLPTAPWRSLAALLAILKPGRLVYNSHPKLREVRNGFSELRKGKFEKRRRSQIGSIIRQSRGATIIRDNLQPEYPQTRASPERWKPRVTYVYLARKLRYSCSCSPLSREIIQR